jgi:hypothetical protein
MQHACITQEIQRKIQLEYTEGRDYFQNQEPEASNSRTDKPIRDRSVCYAAVPINATYPLYHSMVDRPPVVCEFHSCGP